MDSRESIALIKNVLAELNGVSVSELGEISDDMIVILNTALDEEIQQQYVDQFDINFFQDEPMPGPSNNIQYGGSGNNTGTNSSNTQRKGEPLFTITRKTEWTYKKFNMTGAFYTLEICNPDEKLSPEYWIWHLIEGIIEYFKDNSKVKVRPGDKVGMSLRNLIFEKDPIYISLRRSDQLVPDVIFDHIMQIFDSNEDFFLNGHLEIRFDHIQMPHGSGRISRKFGQTSEEFILSKPSYLKYKNHSKKFPNVEYCLPYALVISLAHSDCLSGLIEKSDLRKLQNTFKNLRKAAEELCELSSVKISNLAGGCSIDEVKKFQRVLKDYQIVIYVPSSARPMYTDPRYMGRKTLNIMLCDNHFTAMRSVQACFGAKYLCEVCHTHTDTLVKHKCKYSCTQCHKIPKCDEVLSYISCTDCNRTFFGLNCYKNHLKRNYAKSKSICQSKKNCPTCFCTLDVGHECGKMLCVVCEKRVSKNNHLCHMPKYVTKRHEDDNILRVFFDIETRQDSLLNSCEPEKYKHTPNLLVAHIVCSECIEITDISLNCSKCGEREQVYNSESCIEDFMSFLSEKYNEKEEIITKNENGVEKKKNIFKFSRIVVIAHNLKGFDGQFILKYIYESDRFKHPNLIMNGTKITEISFMYRMKFIDSVNYFQCPLSKLPSLSGFEDSKGHFPHFLNSLEFKNYVGPLPEKHFYGYDALVDKARTEFDEWYNSQPKDYIFDLQVEIVKYCKQDVNILRKACIKFEVDFWNENNIDPFIDACTIAGACNKVFRSNYLEEDTIAVIPPNGYRLANNQSKSALKWLYYMEQEFNIEIRHAGRFLEFSHFAFGRVDGYHEESNTILEYNGCYWHGCPTCYKAYFSGEQTHKDSELLRSRRDETLAKQRSICQAGFKLIVKKECEFMREMEESPELDYYLEMLVSDDLPLNPRDAFFGGRTNANILYFKSDGETKMHYYDICSLYPFVNKVSPYPVSHTKVHVGEKCKTLDWLQMNGLMKATVSAPRRLDFPVLPYKMHKKLLFFLCLGCARTLNQSPCDHDDKQRQFTGTWVIDEVKLAVSKGYKIEKIFEIWDYKVAQYDPVSRTGGFFAGFIDKFLKIKTEASGWPESCTTQEQKDAHIKEFYEREGILLEESKIQDNPSLRSMAKIMLNSFWGRFGMRDDLVRTELIKCGRVLRDRVIDPKNEIHSIVPINDDCLILNYKIKNEAREPNSSTNVVIAAFTTAYARMELYKYLDMLGSDRLYYYDTDSIFFSSKAGQIMPEKGQFLGQMTDELEKFGPGSYINEKVTGGPKNYAYKVYATKDKDVKSFVKVKGITLNFETCKKINFDAIKRMVTEKDKNHNPIEIENNSIRRTMFADVYTTRVKKTYKFDYNKRQMVGDEFRTIPYGY